MTAIEAARAQLESILDRKAKLEGESPLSDPQWQYASGMVTGAREVVAAIERAERES